MDYWVDGLMDWSNHYPYPNLYPNLYLYHPLQSSTEITEMEGWSNNQ